MTQKELIKAGVKVGDHIYSCYGGEFFELEVVAVIPPSHVVAVNKEGENQYVSGYFPTKEMARRDNIRRAVDNIAETVNTEDELCNVISAISDEWKRVWQQRG